MLGGTIFTIIFILLAIGFIDLFVKEPNRCEMTYMYQIPEFVASFILFFIILSFQIYYLRKLIILKI